MLPFENLVADYIKETGNHVLYRVTPIFSGDDLVAKGVEMEAWSVEDRGDGVCFHVYCYNNQPGIKIDYATGDSHTTDGRTGTTGSRKSSAKSTKKHTTELKATKSAVKSSGQSSRTVYTTPTGRCYHYLSGCGGKNSKKTTLKEAKSRGLRPCKKCAA